MNIAKTILPLILGRRLPKISGHLIVPGLIEEVTINRDSWGIPHIQASNDQDAWYGLGFCQGQDRSFQIDILHRIIHGKLSEVAGADSLPIDQLSRRIGFHRSSLSQFLCLSEKTQNILESFACGVRMGKTEGSNGKPHELSLLRTDLSFFQASDSLGILKLLSFTMASNWDSELVRLKILSSDGPEGLKAVDPAYARYNSATVSGNNIKTIIARLTKDLEIFETHIGIGAASNNWAVSPYKTRTGRPMLAGDPHLSPTVPPHWYLAHITTPKWSIGGAAFVGAPGMPAGHNGTSAWAPTAALIDNTDLFIEQLSKDGKSVRQGDRFIECEVLKESISVRGAKPVEEEILISPRGPIICSVVEGDSTAISLKATWLNNDPFDILCDGPTVGSFDEFRRAWAKWPYASLNFVYADTSNTIGWQMVGDVPVRKQGNGIIPMPGWNVQSGWEDINLPYHDLPHSLNPESGYVATANNQPPTEELDPYLGVDWLDDYRITRITELLDSHDDWDLNNTADLQMDRYSIPWRELRPFVSSLPVKHKDAIKAKALLLKWNGNLSSDSAAATIFELFTAKLIRCIVSEKTPNAARWALGKGLTPLTPHSMYGARRMSHLVDLITRHSAEWLLRSWSMVAEESLVSAFTDLKETRGENLNSWGWGKVRPLTLNHLLGRIKYLGGIFNLGPFPWGGDSNTINQAGSSPFNPCGNPFAVSSMRMILDVGNWDECLFSLPGGQSGNPFSRHYSDILPLWKAGKGIPILWTETAVRNAAVNVLELFPEHRVSQS